MHKRTRRKNRQTTTNAEYIVLIQYLQEMGFGYANTQGMWGRVRERCCSGYLNDLLENVDIYVDKLNHK